MQPGELSNRFSEAGMAVFILHNYNRRRLVAACRAPGRPAKLVIHQAKKGYPS